MFTLRSLLRRQTSMAASAVPGPVEESIRAKLTSLLQPVSLQISNDSWQHRHHTAMKNVENTGETRKKFIPVRGIADATSEADFSLEVVSAAFEGQTTMQRHRLIYSALAAELEQGLHALSLKTKTPAEVAAVESA